MATYNEETYKGDIVKWEQEARYSRDVVTVGSGANLAIGTVVGQVVTGGFTVADGVRAGTGNGTVTQSGTASARYGDDVQVGTYVARCIAAAANAGTFRVFAPDGSVVGDATVAVAFASTHINFTINDGSTDFIVGDTYSFVVNQTAEGNWLAYDPAGTDGRQVAAGVLLQDAAAASVAVAKVVTLVRDAVVDSSRLVWPAGFTTAQISTGLAQLEARGIVARKGV
jgi:hypothetical protein